MPHTRAHMQSFSKTMPQTCHRLSLTITTTLCPPPTVNRSVQFVLCQSSSNNEITYQFPIEAFATKVAQKAYRQIQPARYCYQEVRWICAYKCSVVFPEEHIQLHTFQFLFLRFYSRCLCGCAGKFLLICKQGKVEEAENKIALGRIEFQESLIKANITVYFIILLYFALFFINLDIKSFRYSRFNRF